MEAGADPHSHGQIHGQPRLSQKLPQRHLRPQRIRKDFTKQATSIAGTARKLFPVFIINLAPALSRLPQLRQAPPNCKCPTRLVHSGTIRNQLEQPQEEKGETPTPPHGRAAQHLERVGNLSNSRLEQIFADHKIMAICGV